MHVSGRRCAVALLLLAASSTAAVASAEKAMLLAREGVGALLRGKYEQAIIFYDQALAESGVSDLRRANILNDRGVAKWQVKRTRDAIADFNQAIELSPTFSVVFNNRGNALLELGEAKEALADFERAAALAPAYGAAFNNQGNALVALGRPDEALAAYAKAVELMPNSAVPLNGRGKAEMSLGRPYAALRSFSRAVTIDQKYANAYANRGIVLADLNRYSDAIENYTLALAETPEDASLYVGRSRAFAAEGKHGPALRDLNRAVELAPSDAQIFLERGDIYVRLKQHKQAIDDFTHAIEMRRDYVEAYLSRAAALAESGAPEEGLVDLSRVLELKTGDVRALKAMADILEQMGRKDDAMAYYRLVAAGDPKLPEVRTVLRRLTGEVPPVEIEVVGMMTKGWTIARASDGKYFATNPDFAKIRVPLEMYGRGDPKVIDWSVLKNQFRGIGMLRYFAGNEGSKEPTSLEYVAIVDLWKNVVLAIEPYRRGTSHSTWEWREASVVVTDKDGAASEVELRRVQARPDYVSEDWFYNSPRDRRPTRTYRQGPSRGGIFDWLMGR